MTIGEHIKRLRQDRGWTQAELGDTLGVHQKQISGYEREAHVPSTDVLVRIAEAFDVSLDYLVLGGKGNSPRVRVSDRELIEKMEAIDKLSERDRQTIKAVLDTFIVKNRFESIASESAKAS